MEWNSTRHFQYAGFNGEKQIYMSTKESVVVDLTCKALSFATCRLLTWKKFTDISEGHMASIFKVEE
jgi:hypothetical protein